MSSLERRLYDWYVPLQQDLFKYAHAMGVDLTPQQRDLCHGVMAGHPLIAAKSGQGVGKTSASGLIGSWRAFRAKGAMTYVTAPTMRQCKEVWLTEFSRMLEKARVPALRKIFDVTKSRVIINGDHKWGVAFVTATKPEAAQGLHNDHLTIMIDECSGVERKFIDQVMGTLSNADRLCVATGNPNTRDCAFFDFFNSLRDRWHCLTFNSRESPLTSKEQIQYLIDTYGEGSDVVRVRVDGEFPNMDANCIMSSDQLERATRVPLTVAVRETRKRNGRIETAKQFGIDFARFGGDENVIVRRSGNAMMGLRFFPHTEPEDVVANAFAWQQEVGWTDEQVQYCADANGLGDAMMVRFIRAKKNIHEFKAQRRAQSNEFANMTTEAWFTFAKKVRSEKCLIANDPMLLKQLSTRQYVIKSDGKIAIESKDDYVERDGDGRSPDRADATVMAFYDEVETGADVSGHTRREAPQSKVWNR